MPVLRCEFFTRENIGQETPCEAMASAQRFHNRKALGACFANDLLGRITCQEHRFIQDLYGQRGTRTLTTEVATF